MLMVNQLIGFGVGGGGRSLGGVISGGTNIGDIIGSGGLAAAFDGNTNQDWNQGATKGSSPGYVGKTIAKRVFKSISYGSNDHGYANGANPSTTLNLRGKIGSAPANSTDGTLLGTLTFTDTANESGNPREIISTDNETLWDHIFLEVSTGVNVGCVELQLYEAV